MRGIFTYSWGILGVNVDLYIYIYIYIHIHMSAVKTPAEEFYTNV